MAQTARSFPYGSFLPYYANGLGISNNATTPNTQLDVASGTILDSTGTFQLSLSAGVTVNAANSGLNGLDTGDLAASTVYAVLVVADPVMQQTAGAMISLSASAPTLPSGYSAFACIGYIVTDASSHFLAGYWTAGYGSNRVFMYDAPQATAITAGAATSYTAVSLASLVPAVDNTPVWIASSLTPSAAGRGVFLQPAGATGDAVSILGQVTSVVVENNSYLISKLASSVAKIAYKVSTGTDAVALSVAGYEFSI